MKYDNVIYHVHSTRLDLNDNWWGNAYLMLVNKTIYDVPGIVDEIQSCEMVCRTEIVLANEHMLSAEVTGNDILAVEIYHKSQKSEDGEAVRHFINVAERHKFRFFRHKKADGSSYYAQIKKPTEEIKSEVTE